MDLCQRFDAEVEPINRASSWGHSYRSIRGSTTLSNHASGTAIDLNAPQHPLGKKGTFTSAQQRKIKELLDRYDGLVRWGGTYTGRVDEMHFEIVGSQAQIEDLVLRLKPSSVHSETWVIGGLPEGKRLRARSGPSLSSPVVTLRGNGTQLEVVAWESADNITWAMASDGLFYSKTYLRQVARK